MSRYLCKYGIYVHKRYERERIFFYWPLQRKAKGKERKISSKVIPFPFITCVCRSGPHVAGNGHECASCPLCLWDGFLPLHDSLSECLLITRHMHSPPIHKQHYSGTNQEPEKDNVSWKTTRVLITDTLSHAYWLSPGGISKISWICRMVRWRECCRNSEWKTLKDIWIQRAVL